MITRPLLFSFLLIAAPLLGHESPGHPTQGGGGNTKIGTEVYFGKRGYWHSGVGAATPLGSTITLEIGTHVVREENGAREVPSFEAELIYQPAAGLELELFGFAYPKIQGRRAWGAGFRATKRFVFGGGVGLAPFFGPIFAQVRAEDEATESFQSLNHTMLLGGVTLDAGPLLLTLIGSHSIYDRDPAGLETPVDLESMTHFAAYENNDGFVRQSLAVEASWDATSWLAVNVRYAAMWFDDERRHAVSVAPTVKLGEHVEWSAGVQFLRGGKNENNLLFTGLSLAF